MAASPFGATTRWSRWSASAIASSRLRSPRPPIERARLAVEVEYEDNRDLRRARSSTRRSDALGHRTRVEEDAVTCVRRRECRDRPGDGRVRARRGRRPRARARCRRQRPPQPARSRGSGARPACAARSAPGRPTPGRRASSPSLDAGEGEAKARAGAPLVLPARPRRPGRATRAGRSHLAALRRRAARLTKLDLKELHVLDDGTDLRLRIAPFSLWRGGGEEDHWGRKIAMNVPTEECFISPDAAATEGTFRCSRPRSFGGRMFEGLAGEFRGGRLVRLDGEARDRPRLARALSRGDPECRPPRRDRARRRVVPDRPDRSHLLQRPPRRERRRAHGVRLGLREDAHRPDRAAALRCQPLDDAHRRDDRDRLR